MKHFLSDKIIYLFVLLEGMNVMCLELSSVRMIAPYCGETFYVWTSVIGITVFSLAAGYFTGGVLAKNESPPLIYCLLFTSTFFLLLPVLNRFIFRVIETDNYVLFAVINAFFILFPPFILLGSIPPMAIKCLTMYKSDSGRQAGRVYALSTAGSIASALGVGFFLIPAAGITWTLILTAIVTGITPMLLLFRKNIFLPVLYIFIAAFSVAGTFKKKLSADIRILHRSEGILGQNLVVDMIYAPDKIQRLFYINRIGQTVINPQTGLTLSSYPDYIVSLAGILSGESDVLLLGLGGGTVANYLADYLSMNITAVEIDERIEGIARQYFGLKENIRVITDDARHYLEKTPKKYNLIIFDLFKGEINPEHVMSREAFQQAVSLLKSDGFLIVNFNGFLNGDNGKAGRVLYHTMKSCGLDVKILPTYEEEEKHRNNIFIGMTKPLDFSKTRLSLNKDGVVIPLEKLFMQIPEMEGKEVLTDDRPFLDVYNFRAASAWRKEYNERHTRILLQKGIPLFR